MSGQAQPTGSASQSAALAEVVNAVGDLDTLTRENTTLVAQASEKSDQLIGQTFDLDGPKVPADAWAVCDAGGGWVTYDIVSALTSEVRPKSSYVVVLDRDNLLGCGTYLAADILQVARANLPSSEAAG